MRRKRTGYGASHRRTHHVQRPRYIFRKKK